MDSLHDSAGDSKSSVCQCAPKPTVHRWSPGLAVAVCVLMSLSSISVCLLMSFKTLQLEQRLKMELDRATQFNPAHGSFFDEDGSLVPELSTSVGKLVEEKVMVLMPKSRTTRDVGQECACPPGNASSCLVSTVETFKFLGITVSQDLKWVITINSVLKKAEQRMYFLRLLRKHGLLRQFYTAVIESVLCSSITVWFGAATKKDKLRLQRTIKTAEKFVGTRLTTVPQERAKSSRTLHIPVTSSSSSFPQLFLIGLAHHTSLTCSILTLLPGASR
ncbi:uncharacterized protein LOC133484367 isoform X1 [Phyllopteryx taeniolatus]|uniref:uncharacterized protein LOC133484367 isoform X1 n=1 Tax=Phyllopteryx taeniolatus TaxID=161469 RepID=UPI002AD59338|nr:uncharacterized protein LOC133484367 isoform X1 [Phyllopteryx taeniolatus]